jgi:phenylalanyl-tRNA synthetase alpha chain
MDPAEARHTLEQERARGRERIAAASSLDELEEAKVAVVGRKSPLSEVQRSLGALSKQDKPELGRLTNEVFTELREALDRRRVELELGADSVLLQGDAVDVTLPGRRPRPGSLHPLSIVEARIVEIFTRMGYRVAEGPEIDDDWHNFEALNIPPDHPARTMQDTLYVDVLGRPDLLLRTHTSPVQIRAMEAQPPPVYIVVPGRTYRRETPDATHGSVFSQVEGLAVDEGISFAHLRGTLEAFAREMFGERTRVRISPDYFPFVEPGCQAAVSCFVCDGVGCRVCGNGWIELLGAGMVHPKVLENCGYDSERYTGFAFGMGIERVAMVRYGVRDLRSFFDGDVRFLEQFEGVA